MCVRVGRKKNLEKRGVLNPGKLHKNRFYAQTFFVLFFFVQTTAQKNIFCSDDQQRRQLEKQHLLRMTDQDFEFYSDQKGPRLMKCFNIVETQLPLM